MAISTLKLIYFHFFLFCYLLFVYQNIIYLLRKTRLLWNDRIFIRILIDRSGVILYHVWEPAPISNHTNKRNSKTNIVCYLLSIKQKSSRQIIISHNLHRVSRTQTSPHHPGGACAIILHICRESPASAQAANSLQLFQTSPDVRNGRGHALRSF